MAETVQAVVDDLQENAPDSLNRIQYILRSQGGEPGRRLAQAIADDAQAPSIAPPGESEPTQPEG